MQNRNLPKRDKEGRFVSSVSPHASRRSTINSRDNNHYLKSLHNRGNVDEDYEDEDDFLFPQERGDGRGEWNDFKFMERQNISFDYDDEDEEGYYEPPSSSSNRSSNVNKKNNRHNFMLP